MGERDIYSAIIESFDDGVYFIDTDQKIRIWNAAAEKITGYPAKSVTGKSCPDNCPDPVGFDGALLCMGGCPISLTFEDGGTHEAEVFIRHKQGHRIPVSMKSLPVKENGELIGVLGRLSLLGHGNDGKLADSIANLTFIDRFTGLPNRRRLEEVLESKCREYKSVGISFSVVVVGITRDRDEEDDADKLNNVILNAALTIADTVRSGDIAGRWSENEFLVIFTVDTEEKLRIVRPKIGDIVKQAVKSEGLTTHSVRIGSTIVCGSDSAASIVERAKYLSTSIASKK